MEGGAERSYGKESLKGGRGLLGSIRVLMVTSLLAGAGEIQAFTSGC